MFLFCSFSLLERVLISMYLLAGIEISMFAKLVESAGFILTKMLKFWSGKLSNCKFIVKDAWLSIMLTPLYWIVVLNGVDKDVWGMNIFEHKLQTPFWTNVDGMLLNFRLIDNVFREVIIAPWIVIKLQPFNDPEGNVG